MTFINAAIDVILNVLTEGYDQTDEEIIRECLSEHPQEKVEKLVSEWNKLDDMEKIKLKKTSFQDKIQHDWLKKVLKS